MERQPSSPDPLEELEISGQSVASWHAWLCTTPEGEYRPDLGTPGSRYGRSSNDTAWYALSAAFLAEEISGVIPDDPEAAMDFAMSLSVNDYPSIAQIINDHWDRLPSALQDMLDKERVSDGA